MLNKKQAYNLIEITEKASIVDKIKSFNSKLHIYLVNIRESKTHKTLLGNKTIQ